MRISESGRVRRTGEEWQEIVDRFEESRLSCVAFCKREGIAEGSFAKWRKRLQQQGRPQPQVAAAAFVECTAPPAVVSHDMELSLPGGVVLRWKL